MPEHSSAASDPLARPVKRRPPYTLSGMWVWLRYPGYALCFLAGLFSLRLFFVGSVLVVLGSLLLLMGDRRILRESSVVMCLLSGYVMLLTGAPGAAGLIGKGLALSLVALALVQIWRLPAGHPALWRWWGLVSVAGSMQALTAWWGGAPRSVPGMVLALVGAGVGVFWFWYFSTPQLGQRFVNPLPGPRSGR